MEIVKSNRSNSDDNIDDDDNNIDEENKTKCR